MRASVLFLADSLTLHSRQTSCWSTAKPANCSPAARFEYTKAPEPVLLPKGCCAAKFALNAAHPRWFVAQFYLIPCGMSRHVQRPVQFPRLLGAAWPTYHSVIVIWSDTVIIISGSSRSSICFYFPAAFYFSFLMVYTLLTNPNNLLMLTCRDAAAAAWP